MKFISNIKIGTRLMLGFAAILGLTVLVGITAISRLAVINDATADLATNWLVATRSLGDYRAALNTVRRAESQHVMATTEQQFADQEKRIPDGKLKAAEAFRKYEGTVTSDDERLLVKDIKDAELAYYATQAELLSASRKSDGVTDALRTIFSGKSREAFNALLALVEKDVEFQAKGADLAYQLSQATFERTRVVVLAFLIVAVGIGAVFAWIITRSITAPVGQALQLAEAVADGDLTSSVNAESRDEIGQLLRSLGKMNTNLSQIVSKVRVGSESVSTASAEIAQGNQDLSARTESQASALEETAASMEELSSTVKQNADNARQANQLAQSASTVALQGGNVVAQVVDTMREISESSKRIADIISVIDGIAFQTNILALNAAVEAARAGEQGRGFAVVATEVRTLAGRSADAAKEIKSLITESVRRVDQGTHLVDQAGSTMQEVVSSVRRVTDIMGEISAASTEQSAGVNQVGEAVIQMDQVTQQNAALVEEMAAAASSLNSQSQDLVQAVSVFKIDSRTTHLQQTANQTINIPKPPATAKRGPTIRIGQASKTASVRPPKTTALTPVATAPDADANWESF